MLEEIRHTSDLGSPEDMYFLINTVLGGEQKSYSDVFRFLEGKRQIKDLETVLSFLTNIDVLIVEESKYKLTQFGTSLIREKIYFNKNMVFKFFEKLSQSNQENEVVNLNKVEITCDNRMFLRPSDISLKYSSARNFLQRFGFFEYDSQKDVFFIDDQFSSEMELLKQFFQVNNILKNGINKITLEQFKAIQLVKEEYGRLAEEFCFEFERKRLHEHNCYDDIAIISEGYMNAGYDIVSFENVNSINLDRFIEVKSYSGKLTSFYWSENEVNMSKEKGDSYYLYLVNREQISDKTYTPLIIRNPYQNVFLDHNWTIHPNSFFVQFNKTHSEES